MGYYDDVLEHHGILGQKWGVRRFQDKDGRRIKKFDTESNNSNKKESKSLNPSTKKALIIGASVAGGVLAAYGGYRLYQLYNHSGTPDKTGFIKKAKELTADQDMKMVNNGRRANPAFDLLNHFSNNCQKCSIAYEMRRRGYDVKAGESAVGEKLNDIFKIFKGLNDKDPSHFKNVVRSNKLVYMSDPKTDAKDFINIAKSFGSNSRGVATLQSLGGLHSVVWEHDKHGNVILRDCQIGKAFKGEKGIKKYMSMTGFHARELAKINDLPIDTKFLKEKSSGGKTPYIRNSKDIEFGLTELQGALATAGTATVAGLVSGAYTKAIYYDPNERSNVYDNTRTSKNDSTKKVSRRS